jgi:hypothetical protein
MALQMGIWFFARPLVLDAARVSERVPECSHSYLHLSITVFIDLLQSPLQPLQFRPPSPLQPANGLRHSSVMHGCANRTSHTLRPALPTTTCGRTRRHRSPAPGYLAPSNGKRPRHTPSVSCSPSPVIPDPIPPLVSPDDCFPGLLLLHFPVQYAAPHHEQTSQPAAQQHQSRRFGDGLEFKIWSDDRITRKTIRRRREGKTRT